MLRVAARSSLSLGSAGDRLGSLFHGLAPEHPVSRDFHRSAEWMAQSRRLALCQWCGTRYPMDWEDRRPLRDLRNAGRQPSRLTVRGGRNFRASITVSIAGASAKGMVFRLNSRGYYGSS